MTQIGTLSAFYRMNISYAQQGIRLKFIKLSIIAILLSIGLKATTPMELVNSISSLNIDMQYYFFVENGKAFLTREKKDKTYALWYYTVESKWQPIHNSGAFDGYPKSSNNISSLVVNKNSEEITFGSINNDNMTDEIKTLLREIENKTVKIGWYFWVDNNKAFLIRENGSKEISIWHYTSDRKWQPIHNAGAYDGYPKAEKNLENVSFDIATSTLSIGSAISPYGIRLPPSPFGVSVTY